MGQFQSTAAQSATEAEIIALQRCGQDVMKHPCIAELLAGQMFMGDDQLLHYFATFSLRERHGSNFQVLPMLFADRKKRVQQAHSLACLRTAIALSQARFLVVPFGVPSHANAILIDQVEGSVIGIEPHGTVKNDEEAGNVRHEMMSLVAEAGLPEITFMSALWQSVQQHDSLCQMWCPLIARWILSVALGDDVDLFSAATKVQDIQRRLIGVTGKRAPTVDRSVIPMAAFSLFGSAILCESSQATIGEALDWAESFSRGLLWMACDEALFRDTDGDFRTRLLRLELEYPLAHRVFAPDGSLVGGAPPEVKE